jgi:hypothetical protein
MLIPAATDACTVIVTVRGAPAEIDAVARHAAAGLERFARNPGFIAGATHVAEDRATVIQYLQWASRREHEACMADPAWEDDPSSLHFMALMRSGAIDVGVSVVDVVAVVDGASGGRGT